MVMSNHYHTPVLLNNCIDGLRIDPLGVYVDLTYGGGGHSREILKNLTEGRLIGFDQDQDAVENSINDSRFHLVEQNFKFLKNNLRMLGVNEVDGVLADLGVSSHQFDVPDRGFSIRFEAELDMRMNQGSELTAKDVVNEYSENELFRVFKENGELKNVSRLVHELMKHRGEKKILSVSQLKSALDGCVDRKKPNQYYAQVFQALRIEVNDELEALKQMLIQATEVLKEGGRLVVISYHSLEDRLVKNFIKSGNFKGEIEQDFYGKVIKPLKAINNKVIIPEEEEVKQNNRARSAKLRIAEKL